MWFETQATPNFNDDKRKIRTVLRDWQHHKQDFFNSTYWNRRFAPFEEVFARYKSRRPVQLFRSERTDIDNNYTMRYSSWSKSTNCIHDFGWGERRMVTSVFNPQDILVDFEMIGLDTEHTKEVIMRPGNYDVKQYRLVWDRKGFFNYYDDPERYDLRINT